MVGNKYKSKSENIVFPNCLRWSKLFLKKYTNNCRGVDLWLSLIKVKALIPEQS